MTQRNRIRPVGGQRVIPLASHTADSRHHTHYQNGTEEPTRIQEHDWIAWICLTLGILCGVGALYFAISAIVGS